jgi:carbohydrate-selective porin OprB
LPLTDNITITPGVIWVMDPGNNNDNDDIVIGALRTSFSF